MPFPQNKPGEMSHGAEGSALGREVLGSHQPGMGDQERSWRRYMRLCLMAQLCSHWVGREGRIKGESKESKAGRITSSHAKARNPKPIPAAG